MTDVPSLVTVPVKSAFLSKINWTQLAGLGATLITTNAFGLDPATQVKVVTAFQTIQAIATIVLKNYFTTTITPSAAAKV